jgi:hypothetical protein
MLGGLFVLGSLGFWLLTIGVVIALMVLVEFEKNFISLCLVAATAALLYFGGNSDAFRWFVDHPLQVGLAILGYILAGSAWSIVKWFLFVVEKKEKFLEFKAHYLNTHPEGIEGFKKMFNDNTVSVYDTDRQAHFSIRKAYGIPEPRDYKSRIVGWMGWWPWSLLNAILFDFFKKVFQHIYNVLTELYRSIAKKVYGDITDDLVKP